MDIAAILTARFPDALWGESNNDYATLVWDESNADPKPTKEMLEALWPEVESERKWAAVRVERDRLLAASDWTQAADAPVDAQAWAVYRQALRDIPQTQDDPDGIVWPEAP